MARAKKEREETLPKPTREANKEAEQAKQGKAAMPVPKGSAEMEGPKKLPVVDPRRKRAAPCVVFRCPQKQDPTDCVTFRKMSSRHRLRTRVQ